MGVGLQVVRAAADVGTSEGFLVAAPLPPMLASPPPPHAASSVAAPPAAVRQLLATRFTRRVRSLLASLGSTRGAIAASLEAAWWRPLVTVTLPPVVHDFIEAFDACCYPALLRDEDRPRDSDMAQDAAETSDKSAGTSDKFAGTSDNADADRAE